MDPFFCVLYFKSPPTHLHQTVKLESFTIIAVFPQKSRCVSYLRKYSKKYFYFNSKNFIILCSPWFIFNHQRDRTGTRFFFLTKNVVKNLNNKKEDVTNKKRMAQQLFPSFLQILHESNKTGEKQKMSIKISISNDVVISYRNALLIVQQVPRRRTRRVIVIGFII